jgi:predicted ABC-class ATPase
MRGRGGGRGGAYYKEKYGGGGRGGGGRRQDDGDSQWAGSGGGGGSSQQLRDALARIQGKSYPAYNDIRGAWDFPGAFTLHVDKIQADPYAAPSRCRVVVPAQVARLPPALLSSRIRRVALADFLGRAFGAAVAASGGDARAGGGGWAGDKGGEMAVDAPGQHVLERSSAVVRPDGSVEARFTVGLPARGRTVLGDWAAAILTTNLPRYVRDGLTYERQDAARVAAHVACVEDTEALRALLPGLGLVAFVGDGAVLPRASGADDAPMPAAQAPRPFSSPAAMAVEVELPNRGRVRGMGVRRGVTLVCGGGFHGKSTVLEALQCGVYNKVPGDGRELVATEPGAVKIRAEDGRRVAGVDISPFINNLPLGRPTHCFSSPDASGSTSQAANVQEALEAGATCLLIDEVRGSWVGVLLAVWPSCLYSRLRSLPRPQDTSATNFMLRDARMRELVSAAKEPITPFAARVRALAAAGVSCVLVVGGSGEYLAAADAVVLFDSYEAHDATARARAIADAHPSTGYGGVEAEPYPPPPPRTLVAVQPGGGGGGGRPVRAKTRALHAVQLEDEELDLGGVEQLVEVSQTRAVAAALLLLRRRAGEAAWRGLPLAEALRRLDAELDAGGLDALGAGAVGDLARPRMLEVAAAVNRLRCATMQQLPRR